MELRDVVRALRSSWWIPLAVGLGGGVSALVISLASTPLYTSQTQLFVSTAGSDTATDVLQGSQFSQQRVTSYATLLTGDELASRVIDRLGLRSTSDLLSDRITATVVPNTVLVDVTVTDTSPRAAQEIAAAVGAEFIDMVNELERPASGEASPVKVTVTEAPRIPEEPSSPRTTRNVAVALLAGLLFGAGLTVLRAQLDRSVKDQEEASARSGASVIGAVIRDATLESRHVIDWVNPTRVAEDYRRLRTNLQFLRVDDPPQVIMVSSAMPAEGKTTVVINLALALSEAGHQVTVVDADLRRPRVVRYLGLVGGVGLTNVLAGTAEVGDVLQSYGDGSVSVIGAGPVPPNPSELLSSTNMSKLLDEVREKSGYVLIDAPPLLPVADSTGLAPLVDGVLLSVRYGKTQKDQLQQAAATLDRVGGRTLGVILNMVPPKAEVASTYGYGTDYSSEAASTPGSPST